MRDSHASRELVRACIVHDRLEARKSNFIVIARQSFGREKFCDFSSILLLFQGNVLSLVILFVEH